MPIHPPAVLAATSPRTAELDRLGDDIAELCAHLDAATARLLALIREFDARGGWNTGFRSCAHWLAWRVGLDMGAASERVRVARALATLPRLAEALSSGQLSYAKIRALTRVATPDTEARLLAVGRAGTAAHVERIIRGWRRVDRQAGRGACRGRLSPEMGELLLRALDAARETSPKPRCITASIPARPASGTSRGPRGRRCAGRRGASRPIHAGRDGPRFRGNVPPLGVRREPGRDAARSRGTAAGDRRWNPGHSSGVAAGTAPSGPDLPVPGLRGAGRPGASRTPLGSGLSHHAGEPRPHLPAASPHGP